MEEHEFDYCAVGLSSRVGMGRIHVVMLDIDSYSFEKVCEIATELINDYCLSNAYVFRSSLKDSKPHWHMVFLDKISTFYDVYKIIEQYADYGWLEMSRKRKEFVIRVSPRFHFEDGEPFVSDVLQFITIVLSPYQKTYQKSNAHRLALEKIYGLRIKRDETFDTNSTTKMCLYTMSKEENGGGNVG